MRRSQRLPKESWNGDLHIKMDTEVTGCENADWFRLAEDRGQWRGTTMMFGIPLKGVGCAHSRAPNIVCAASIKVVLFRKLIDSHPWHTPPSSSNGWHAGCSRVIVWPNAAQVTTCFAPVKVLGSLTISLSLRVCSTPARLPYNAWNVQVRECNMFVVFNASSAILAQQGFDVWHFIIPMDYLLPVFAVEIGAVYNYSFFFF